MDPTITFYDIASAPPRRSYAPNPWKTRLALNFKSANYRTHWVELPDVTSTRRELKVAPNRTLPDGSPFYTLPIIKNGDAVVGDSFEIAQYLDSIYLGPTLLPPGTRGLQKAFNLQVDAVFTNHVLLCVQGFPWSEETIEQSKQIFVQRAGVASWDDFKVEGEARAKMLASFEQALEALAKVYAEVEGPWVGEEASYADLIVGGWVGMVKATMAEWSEVRTWHGGFLGKLDEAIERKGWWAIK